MSSIVDDYAAIGAGLAELRKGKDPVKVEDKSASEQLAKQISDSWMYSVPVDYQDTAPSEYVYTLCGLWSVKI